MITFLSFNILCTTDHPIQSNKNFKSKHASKGSIKAANKGELHLRDKFSCSGALRAETLVGKIASPSASHKPAKNVSSSSKKARINAQAQKRELKRKNVTEDIKFFSTSSGGGDSNRLCVYRGSR